MATACTIKLVIDARSNTLLYAHCNSDFVDFLFGTLMMPQKIMAIFLKNDPSAPGCVSNLHRSVELLKNVAGDPQVREDLLSPNVDAVWYRPLAIFDSMVKPEPTVLMYQCNRGADWNCSRYYRHKSGCRIERKCPHCASKKGTKLDGLLKDPVEHIVEQNGLYMVTDDLVVTPLDALFVLKGHSVKDISHLQEKVVTVGMNEAMRIVRASFYSKTVLSDVFLRQCQTYDPIADCLDRMNLRR